MLEWLEVRLDVRCDKRLVYMSTALNRWSATEMRWNKNAVSWSSPVAALNRRPASVRKSQEQGAITPEFQARCLLGYFCSVKFAQCSKCSSLTELLELFLVKLLGIRVAIILVLHLCIIAIGLENCNAAREDLW